MKWVVDCVLQELVDFFFSSRRRHTRSLRDWSSDVCSSDLSSSSPETRSGWRLPARRSAWTRASSTCPCRSTAKRSEERRVGKECRSRWSQYQSKKKQTSTTERNRTHTQRQMSHDTSELATG